MAGTDVTSGLLSAGVSAATGNYVSAALSLVGTGLSIFGGDKQADIQQQIAKVSQDKIVQEGLENDQKQKAMELSSRRQQLEVIRNTQRARAMGLQASVSQGAQYGSGISGGLAQENARGGTNLLGIQQNTDIATNIFGLDRKISADNSQMVSLQGQLADAGKYGQWGAALTKSADPLGRLSGQMFASGPTTLGGPNGPTPFS